MTQIGQRLYAAEQVRELDRRAIGQGAPGYTLMQRAARRCWEEIHARWPGAHRVAVVCGSGNNGGDGFLIASLAQEAGRAVSVMLVGEPPSGGDAGTAHAEWLKVGNCCGLDARRLAENEVIVDALFGIGLTRPLAGEALAAVEAINRAHATGVRVLAVDVPSGLSADSGAVLGHAVRADVTVSFIGRKLGLHTGAGPDHVGKLVFDTLGVSDGVHEGLVPLAVCLEERDLRRYLPPRPRDAHKGGNGHVLVVGGDEGMAGAALLAARGALRAGAGLVTLATRAAHATSLTAAQPELMCHGIEARAALNPLIGRADVILAGPGLGQGEWGRTLLARVLESGLPLVLDADALNLLAEDPVESPRWVLTPHPGEAARLLDWKTAQVQHDRVTAVRALRERYGGVVVLKGAGSLVQGESLALCPHGNPGMAVGGMGDVLAGILAALLAQGLAPEPAARAAVLAHAIAGDHAACAGERGLLPGDLLDELRAVVNP